MISSKLKEVEDVNIIELIDIEKDYADFKALDKVSFAIKKGSIYGFAGENGAGKTTTMNIICGLSKATKGQVIFKGRPLKDNEVRKDIGYLPQSPKFYEFMTCNEYLDFIISLYGRKDKAYRDELLKMTGLEGAGRKIVKSLSGGMRQRLGLACAIVNEPELLILDEPVSALDPEGRRDVLNIIKSLRDKGMTIFFSTHLLNDAENLCDYLTILHHGKVVKSESMENLKKQYASIMYECEVDKGEGLRKCEKPSFIESIEEKDNKFYIKVKNETMYDNELYEFLLSKGALIKYCQKKEFKLEEAFFDIVKEAEGYGV